MSWNLLAYAVPAFECMKVFARANPESYHQYETTSESAHASTVKAVVHRVLTTEHQSQAGCYKERITGMLEQLPKSCSKNIHNLIEHRLKVISATDSDGLYNAAYSLGTDNDLNTKTGHFFIGINPNIEPLAAKALPWIATHELRHLLANDTLTLPAIKTIASLSAAALSTLAFGWGLLPTACAAVAANMIAHTIVSIRAENRADDFANQHCTETELSYAIDWLKDLKNSKPEGALKSAHTVLNYIDYPSEDARIAKIQEVLQRKQRA